jgi:GNAT superfamily N-acetyltransferase
MKIVDLESAHLGTYCKCLEEWSHEFDDEGGHKRKWYELQKERGLRVKLAKNEKDEIVGMIQYIPSEHAPMRGTGLYYVYCIWVHGHKQGVGDNQHRGIGKMLLAAAEEDAEARGAKGMAAWGLRLPFFMRSSWFKRNGYKSVDTDGMAEMVLKRFSPDAVAPAFIKQTRRVEAGTDKVKVTCFMNGWCPAQNIVYERARRAAEEHKGQVEFIGIDTSDRRSLEEFGIADGLFVDSKRIRTGPPPSYDKIRRIVERGIRRRALPLTHE